MPASSDAIVSLVQAVKAAIQDAQDETPDIVVTQAVLEVKATTEGGPAVGFKWGPVEIGGAYTKSQVMTLSLTLTPMPKVVELMSVPEDALVAAIASVSEAARAAVASEPRFGLEQAVVTLNIGVTKSGKLTAVVGGGVSSDELHTLTLTLKGRG
ncbi:MAG: hypothetical protein JOZ27_06665 [Caulobacteraceae bacterium]|nr:hypothetical protein [Caulobacteraceae bacterium]